MTGLQELKSVLESVGMMLPSTRIAIAGPEDFDNLKLIYRVLDRLTRNLDEFVVETSARYGCEMIAERWAAEQRKCPIRRHHPDVEKWKGAAAKVRLRQMLWECTWLIAFQDDKCEVTDYLIDKAEKYLLRVSIIRIEDYV
jgi:hypothetical protein